ncbi:MAG TPA: hypothetical protein VGQ10_05065 [Vicinamibacterales bacterium]|nr:hypothetical protein [Vicinamibacterales bacterium]
MAERLQRVCGYLMAPFKVRSFMALLACITVLAATRLAGEPVAVRHVEGLVHGFLALRTLDGKTVADGDLIQNASGDRVTSRLVFRFKDGSLRDETAVFSQGQHFRLLSDRLVQKGPTFPQPLEMTIDCASGRVNVRYTDKNGSPKVEDEQLELPPDLANGITLTLLKNVKPDALPASLSMVVPTPKPRLVKLALSNAGEERFVTGQTPRKATHYIVKVEIGGIAGLIAPLVGKQPPDSHVWVLGGEAPAFVKSEGPMFLGGPNWRIELVSPSWRQTSPTR